MALGVERIERRTLPGDLLGVDEHAAGSQGCAHAGEEVALARVVEVVDRQGRDDRVPRPRGQRIAEVAHDVRRALAEALAGLREHGAGAVEQGELRRREGLRDEAREQAVPAPRSSTRAGGRPDRPTASTAEA